MLLTPFLRGYAPLALTLFSCLVGQALASLPLPKERPGGHHSRTSSIFFEGFASVFSRMSDSRQSYVDGVIDALSQEETYAKKASQSLPHHARRPSHISLAQVAEKTKAPNALLPRFFYYLFKVVGEPLYLFEEGDGDQVTFFQEAYGAYQADDFPAAPPVIFFSALSHFLLAPCFPVLMFALWVGLGHTWIARIIMAPSALFIKAFHSPGEALQVAVLLGLPLGLASLSLYGLSTYLGASQAQEEQPEKDQQTLEKEEEQGAQGEEPPYQSFLERRPVFWWAHLAGLLAELLGLGVAMSSTSSMLLTPDAALLLGFILLFCQAFLGMGATLLWSIYLQDEEKRDDLWERLPPFWEKLYNACSSPARWLLFDLLCVGFFTLYKTVE